jgi:hypothetical protein
VLAPNSTARSGVSPEIGDEAQLRTQVLATLGLWRLTELTEFSGGYSPHEAQNLPLKGAIQLSKLSRDTKCCSAWFSVLSGRLFLAQLLSDKLSDVLCKVCPWQARRLR